MYRLYLSGPITKDPEYKRKFDSAREQLEAKGYDVVNPAELTKMIGGSFTYNEIMDIDLDILSRCDVLVQLPSWEESRGANIEYGYAKAQGLIILSLEALPQGGGTLRPKN